MTGSMHRPDLSHQFPPLPYQGSDLVGLVGQHHRKLDQGADLAFHQRPVRMWDYPAIHHCPVSVQGLAGDDDALIGFFGGHAIMCSNGTSAVNGGAS